MKSSIERTSLVKDAEFSSTDNTVDTFDRHSIRRTGNLCYISIPSSTKNWYAAIKQQIEVQFTKLMEGRDTPKVEVVSHFSQSQDLG